MTPIRLPRSNLTCQWSLRRWLRYNGPSNGSVSTPANLHLKSEAEQALAEIEIDLFDRPLAPSRSNDNTNIYTSLGE